MTKKQRAEILVKTLNSVYPTITPELTYTNIVELLVAVILSARTTDKQVNVVTRTLFAKYKTVDDYVQADPKTFEREIAKIGIYKTKAKNILATMCIIQTQHNGNVPNTLEDLIALPGVGRKTANVVLANGFGITEGIAVDTHVKRITTLHGLTKHENTDKIEQDLMKLIPKKEWKDITNRLVQYGRDYCPARTHNHDACPISMALKSA